MTDSLLATRGYSTPPDSSPYLPASPLDLVTKNFQAAAAAAQFSQVSITKTSFIDKFAEKRRDKSTDVHRLHSIHIYCLYPKRMNHATIKSVPLFLYICNKQMWFIPINNKPDRLIYRFSFAFK